MLNWRSDYAAKLVSAEEAVRCVTSGHRVVFGNGCGEPQKLVAALVERAAELRGVEIVHMIAVGRTEYCKPAFRDSFFHNSLFVGGGSRQAVADGRADYTPVFFFEIPRLFSEGRLPIDVAFIQLSPPDKFGNCSFGISVDYTKPAAKAATTVVAQINPKMPRTHGDAFIHVTQLDCIVECDDDLIEEAPPPIGPVEEAIGRRVAELVDDGATLQLGIGAIPDAVLTFLHDRTDLGIHSEMFSDGVVELVEAGVITNRRKKLYTDKMVATLLMGTRRLYDFVDDNTMVRMFPVDHVNNPSVIGQNDRVVAINSALQVDLLGQVVADTIGPLQYTGVGGQVDFFRGAAFSAGGKSIIALPSTAKGGTISRIVATPAPGAAITTSRAEVDYVVTEHGVAHLKGRRMRERAEALLAIADPAFQVRLEEDLAASFGEGWLGR